MATCVRCGRKTSMRLVESHDQAHLCRLCLDRQAPALRLGTLAAALTAYSPKADRQSCPYCGWTAEEAVEKGLVGCPLCYEALDPALWPHFGL